MMTLLIALAGSVAPVAPKPPPAFAVCSACHATQARAPARIGPNLYGVADRKAGTLPGFAYSAAMKGAGLSWNEKSLDAFLTSPQKVVPGTRMPYAGEKDTTRRAAIVQYLLALR
jgi:cytochrome c